MTSHAQQAPNRNATAVLSNDKLERTLSTTGSRFTKLLLHGAEQISPLPGALASMPWENILKSLESGVMKAQGAQLPPEDRIAVARYLGKVDASTPPAMSGFCAAGAKPKSTSFAWNG